VELDSLHDRPPEKKAGSSSVELETGLGLGRAPHRQDPAPPPLDPRARARRRLHPRDAVASLVLVAVLRRVRDHDSVRAALVDTARATAASAFAALLH
jgi:hypothetical protein